MILGTGIDVVDVSALAKQLRTPGSPWLDRVFTARELRRVQARVAAIGADDEDVHALALHVGVRWAAKEAVIKAWSAALTGSAPPVSEEDLDLREIEIVHDHWGRPSVALHGQVLQAVAASLAAGSDSRSASTPLDHTSTGGASSSSPLNEDFNELRWHVSLSHDGDTAVAMVILEGPTA